MSKTILFVHQSADLYGSDRVLLTLVTRLDRTQFTPIVLVPVDGPLVAELAQAGIECHVLPITRLSRATLSLRGLMALPADIFRSVRAVTRCLQGRRVDVAHSNTLAVLSGAVWARWHRVPHVWHVHEIIETPVIVRKAYALMLRWFADRIVCVSRAVEQNLVRDRGALASKIVVVWNGVDREATVNSDAVARLRRELGASQGNLVVALVGRINRWKGQRLLVAAATRLWQEGVRNLRFAIVGSVVPGQEYFFDALKHDINSSPARDCFTVIPFTPDVWPVWDACDIAVIPSTEPEPFGMVALEAMASGKPIIAADHGGLADIILNQVTGYLVPPGDADALAEALEKLAASQGDREEMGRRGYSRYRDNFLVSRFVMRMQSVYAALS